LTRWTTAEMGRKNFPSNLSFDSQTHISDMHELIYKISNCTNINSLTPAFPLWSVYTYWKLSEQFLFFDKLQGNVAYMPCEWERWRVGAVE
jgi:hypothetical protein